MTLHYLEVKSLQINKELLPLIFKLLRAATR